MIIWITCSRGLESGCRPWFEIKHLKLLLQRVVWSDTEKNRDPKSQLSYDLMSQNPIWRPVTNQGVGSCSFKASCLRALETFLAQILLRSSNNKLSLNLFRNMLLPQQMFLARPNVSATMFPRLRTAVRNSSFKCMTSDMESDSKFSVHWMKMAGCSVI